MQPPHVDPAHAKRPFPWPIVLVSASLVVFFGGFFAIWQFLSPTDRATAVTYSTFLDDVHAGRVSTVRVHDRDIDYELRMKTPTASGVSRRHTIGPVPDQAFLDTLKPTDPNEPAPHIIFEK